MAEGGGGVGYHLHTIYHGAGLKNCTTNVSSGLSTVPETGVTGVFSKTFLFWISCGGKWVENINLWKSYLFASCWKLIFIVTFWFWSSCVVEGWRFVFRARWAHPLPAAQTIENGLHMDFQEGACKLTILGQNITGLITITWLNANDHFSKFTYLFYFIPGKSLRYCLT